MLLHNDCSGRIIMSAAGMSSHPDAEDVLESCLEFLGLYVTKSLRIKYDKWQKLVTADESKVSA